MNYILEITAFEQWLETHYLPISPQLLWYKLMNLCNRSGWSEWVTVDNLRLMAAMQMSREATLIKARDELIKAGLIEYQKGKKGSPNRYHIISLAEKNTFKSVVYPVVQSEVQSVVYPVVQSEVQSVDIYKQNKNKIKQENTPPVSPIENFEEFLSAYPKPCNRYLAEQEYTSLLQAGKVTGDELVKCAVNYADSCRIEGKPERYIKNAENFLRELLFEKYLPGRYKRPAGRNSFHDFPQRDYDFDQLEKDLLSAQERRDSHADDGRRGQEK